MTKKPMEQEKKVKCLPAALHKSTISLILVTGIPQTSHIRVDLMKEQNLYVDLDDFNTTLASCLLELESDPVIGFICQLSQSRSNAHNQCACLLLSGHPLIVGVWFGGTVSTHIVGFIGMRMRICCC